jgi:hypothetical protein
MPFVYTSDALNSLDQSISIERLASYLASANGDKQRALLLYDRNRLLSEGLYGMLQGLEVALRNSIHREMSADTGRSDWYDRPGTLFQPESGTVAEAKASIPAGKPMTPARVVAQLTFGFWVKLLGRNYEKAFWVPHLYKSFPHLRRPNRRNVFDRLDKIRSLRNSIAHHEKILHRDLKADYSELLETLAWICPVTASWLNIHNSLQVLIYL